MTELPPPDRPVLPAAPPREGRSLAFSFSGSPGQFARLWFVCLALSLLTLGIYSAWAKVRVNQYLFRHTWLDGDHFDYVASPVAILRGRVIVALVLAALWGLQSLTSLPWVAALMLLLLPWAVVRARAFSAHASTFRGLRFRYAAEVGDAYAAYLGAFSPALFTCGIAYPYSDHRLTRLTMQDRSYGDLHWSWQAPVGDYFSTYLVTAVLALPVYAWSALGSDFGPLASAAGAYALLLLPTAHFRARSQNLALGNLTIGGHRLRSAQRTSKLLGIYATNALAILSTLGLALPWARLRTVRYRIECLSLEAWGPLQARALEHATPPSAVGAGGVDLGGVDLGIG